MRPSRDHSTKVWFKLAQWFQRSWLKCEKLTDGWKTDDGYKVKEKTAIVPQFQNSLGTLCPTAPPSIQDGCCY
jgi:hypothetical protein